MTSSGNVLVSQIGAAIKKPENGAIQFSLYCHSFPLFVLLTACDKATDTGQKPRAYKRKETPGKPGVSEINAAISATIGSGETGIRTLGTREGTPVFKTGAIGRSAISPGRMLRPGVWIVNEFPLAGNSIEQVGNQ